MRRRYGVILAVIGYIVLFFCMEGSGEDWKLFGATATGNFYYDTENITHPSKDVVRVSIKRVYTDKGVSDLVGALGEQFKTVSYSVDLYEVHCADKNFRLLSWVAYSTDGGILESFNYEEPKWKVLVPESIMDALYKTLCE